MGGGTGMVGGPSFKEEARKLMTIETIEENIASLKRIFANYLDYDRPGNGAMMINNADWLRPLNYLEFLRDVGRHFSVNRMLAFDSVKTRLDREQSLSFLEFNYMILQPMISWSSPSAMTAACRWAARTSGATSSTASISATAWARRSSTR